MKKQLKYGPQEALGLCKILAAFQGDLTQKQIVTDLVDDCFQLTEKKKDEIKFQVLSTADKRQLGFRDSEQVMGWDPNCGPDFWAVDLSKSEWDVLKLAMERYDKWELSDRWEQNITKQLRKEDNNGNKEQP
jgi:hypothetical protein